MPGGCAKREPLVSVVIPVYNASEVLGQTLDALERQTLGSFEVLCVDDGSTDDSATVVLAHAMRDDRFVLVEKENGGAASARNMGMAGARGRYLMFLDADDLYEPTLLEDMVRGIEEGDADVCVCEADAFDHNTQEVTPRYRLPNDVEERTYEREELEGRLFQIVHNSPWNKLFRRSFVQGTGLVFQDLPSSNDVFFVQASMAFAQRIAFVRKPLVSYRFNRTGSLQDGRFKNPLCPLEAGEHLFEVVQQAGVLSEAGMRSLSNRCWQQVIEGVTSAAGADVLVGDTLFRARFLSSLWGLDTWRPKDFCRWDAAYLHWCIMRARPNGLVWAFKGNGTTRATRSLAQKARVALRLGIAACAMRGA